MPIMIQMICKVCKACACQHCHNGICRVCKRPTKIEQHHRLPKVGGSLPKLSTKWPYK